MSKHKKYTPKHAAPRPSRRADVQRSAARSTAVASGVAVGLTGVAVGAGVLTTAGPEPGPAAAAAPAALSIQAFDVSAADAEAAAQERTAAVSRSADRREGADPAQEAELSQEGGPALSRSEDASDLDPRAIARALLGEYGFSSDQFGCLDSLWVSESGWRVDADNPTSSAYGIPQALTQLHDLPADYMTNAESQIRWGLDYIRDAYGSPCSAWSFKQGNNWY